MSAAALLSAFSPTAPISGGDAGDAFAEGSANSDGLAATNITLGGSFAVGGGSKATTEDVGGGQNANAKTPANIAGLPAVSNIATPILIGLGSLGLLLFAWKTRN